MSVALCPRLYYRHQHGHKWTIVEKCRQHGNGYRYSELCRQERSRASQTAGDYCIQYFDFCKGFREDKQGAECEDARTGKSRKRFSFSDDSRQNVDYRQG
mmetsp:Transcript_68094/g.162538  ORF Transcript_68094/g.162538 Transcript_68094/m.162538 type:complete len:100 (+) Transcript_68094:505-804(+)